MPLVTVQVFDNLLYSYFGSGDVLFKLSELDLWFRSLFPLHVTRNLLKLYWIIQIEFPALELL